MDLHPYIELLRRRIWFVLEAIIVVIVVIVAVVSGAASSLRPAKYASSGRFYLQPDSPAEQLNPGQVSVRDPSRFVQAQIDIPDGEAVAQQAADSLGGITAKTIQRKTSVRASSSSDVLEVTATDGDPVRARDIAAAVIDSYIENRRRSAVDGLDRAAEDIDDRLEPLRASLADFDARIAALPPAEQASDAGGRALRSQRDATAALYESLSARRQELAVNLNLQRGGAEVIGEAKTPTDPVSPRPIRDAVASALVGILGAGIVLLREQLDDRLRSVTDVERALSLPILAELPIDDNARAGVAAILTPHSPLTER